MTVFTPSSLTDASIDRPVRGRPAPSRLRGRPLRVIALLLCIAAAVSVPALFLARGTGLKTSLLHRLIRGHAGIAHPFISQCRPTNTDGIVPCNVFVAADILLPNSGSAIDPATVNAGSIRLIRRGDNTVVPARVNTSAGGDSLVLQPNQPLEPNTTYRFEVLPALKDSSGASFVHYVTTFTTGGAGPAAKMPIAFEQVALPQTAGHQFTGLTVGPDGRLYACTYDGSIFRYDLAADGAITATQSIDTIRASCRGPRLITGICFDPASTSDAPILYVSHGECTRTAAADWTGRLSRLTGTNLERCQDVLVGLPRAARDHLNNQMAFGPDGALYLAQGSNTAMGAPDAAWGNRPEHKLNAAILRIDLAAIATLPLDVKTEGPGAYDPAASGAAVTVYAAGLRNAYDLVWHRNGHLYAPINGSAAGGNTPTDPVRGIAGLANLRLTIPDHLAMVEAGRYYGHPNPSRGQYVLMGGNPKSASAEVRIKAYPPGTDPDPKWMPPAMDFGRNLAPCGIIEYRGSGPSACLDGALMVCRYSGGKDICVVVPNADGSIREMMTDIDGLTQFADPLDLAQHPTTGNLYVAEFGGKRITLVRVKPGYESARVYRQPISGTGNPLEELAQPAAHSTAGADQHAD